MDLDSAKKKESSKDQSVVFDSKDIKKRDTSKFFTRVKKEKGRTAEENEAFLIKKAEKKQERKIKCARIKKNLQKALKSIAGFFFGEWHKFVTIGVLVVALVLTGVIYTINYHQRLQEEQIAEDQKVFEEAFTSTPEYEVSKNTSDAIKAFEENNYREGCKIYEAYIESVKDDKVKYNMAKLDYADALLRYFNITYVDQALELSLAAEKDNPDLYSANLLSRIYEIKGDQEKADFYRNEEVLRDLADGQEAGEADAEDRGEG